MNRYEEFSGWAIPFEAKQELLKIRWRPEFLVDLPGDRLISDPDIERLASFVDRLDSATSTLGYHLDEVEKTQADLDHCISSNISAYRASELVGFVLGFVRSATDVVVDLEHEGRVMFGETILDQIYQRRVDKHGG